MKRLTGLIRQTGEFGESVKELERQFKLSEPLPIVINGLSGGAASAYLVEALSDAEKISGTASLIVTGTEAERERVFSLLSSYGLRVMQYKPRDFVFHNISASHDVERERLSVLTELAASSLDAVVATPSAILQHTMPRSVLTSHTLSLAEGDEAPPEELVAKLTSLGFRSVDAVDGVGQFSRRGGIIDLWAHTSEPPVRIEFFGDEIDRMTFFDAISQRSEGRCKSIELIPATELVTDADALGRVKKTVESLLKHAKSEESARKLSEELAVIDSHASLNFLDKYIDIVYRESESLLSYFDKKCAVFVLGTNEAREECRRAREYLSSQRAGLTDNGLVPEKSAVYADPYEAFEDFLTRNPAIHINSFSGGMSFGRLAGLYGFRSRRTVSYGGNSSMLFEDLKNYRKNLWRVIIFSPTRAGAESLMDSLTEAGIPAASVYESPEFDITSLTEPGIFVDVGEAEGFELIIPKIATLSMAEDRGRAVMANRRRQRILRKVGGAGKRIMSYAELTVGDYVVHANYGIGLF